MKKIIHALVLTVFCAAAVSAYNPPAGGESLFEISNPNGLMGGATVTGGALFSAGPDSICVNPALAAGEQRVALNLADTMLFSAGDGAKFGDLFQLGILIPFKLYVFSGYVNGAFVPLEEMNVRNSLNAKAGLSKEITEKLDVGLSLNTGFGWGAAPDWALSANAGFVYKYGDLAFMKDFRFAGSVLNLGKTIAASSDAGTNTGSAVTGYPTLATVKAGASATFFSTDIMKLGAALDLTIPAFQNVILDAGVKFAVKDLTISVAEKVNLVESVRGSYNFVPSIGIVYKFNFDVKNNDYLEKNGWSESELNISSAYKNMYSTVHAASFGADLKLGMQDVNPPVIEIKFVEDEE